MAQARVRGPQLTCNLRISTKSWPRSVCRRHSLARHRRELFSAFFTHFTRLYTTFWPIAPRERAHRGISTRTSIKAESARDAQVLITPLLATADPAQHQPPHWAATSGISHSLPSPRATAVRALFGSAALSCRHTGTHQSASTQQHILRELRSSPRSIPRDGLSRKNKKSS